MLVKRFPRLSETFVLNEFLELRRRGLPAELFAIMDPHEPRSQPEALELAREITYLQHGALVRLLPQAARAARRHPWGALKAAAWVVSRHSWAAIRNYVLALTLVGHLDEGGFGHLHAHFAHSPAAIAFIAHKISGVPYSVTGHAKDIYTTLDEDLVMRSRSAVFVATCTDANRQYLMRQTGLGPDRIMLCRHGVDLKRFACLPRVPQAGRILAIGRLVPKKGFDVLLDACSLLIARGHDFKLRVIGSGDLRAHLEAQARDLGIDAHVQIGGARPQPELLVQFSGAEIFALSPVALPNGDRDGVPNVIMEAMAAGVPVVSTSVSAIPEVIEDRRNGLLVPPADPEALADALQLLLTDAELRRELGKHARKFALENLSLSASVEPLLHRFSELIGADGQL